jgi:hypothetical protein
MNDKKKLAIVIALAVVVLGIGAFQFVNMSGEAKPQVKAVAKTEAPAPEDSLKAEDEGVDPALQGLLVLNTSARDPFQSAALPLAEGQTAPPPPVVPPRSGKTSRPPSDFQLPPSLGGLKPFDPGVNGGTKIEPGPKLRLPGEFSYRVAGVITGNRPAAVFVDDSGNQRLVTIGSSLDGDSQLVGVERGHVIVRHKGKTQTLTVGGTPNDK